MSHRGGLRWEVANIVEVRPVVVAPFRPELRTGGLLCVCPFTVTLVGWGVSATLVRGC